MNARFELNTAGPDRQLVVETRGAADLRITIRDAQHPSQTYNLTQDERKALAAFLLSSPDAKPAKSFGKTTWVILNDNDDFWSVDQQRWVDHVDFSTEFEAPDHRDLPLGGRWAKMVTP